MDNRRKFIKQTIYTGTGLILPSYLFWGCGSDTPPNVPISQPTIPTPTRPQAPVQANMFGGVSKVIGYLVPVLIEQGVKKLFDSIGNTSNTPSSVVDQSINIFANGQYDVSTSYNNHYSRIVRPKIGTERLNGIGFHGDDPTIKSRMNDMGARATTPIHSARDLDTFDVNSWNAYCDLADLQTDDSGRVYVTPRDERQDAWKDTFYVDQDLAYVLYNPIYYCHGLPIENPQRQTVNESLKRQIYQKTGLETSKSVYYTQRFFFQGTNCKTKQSQAPENIFYGVDDALHQFFALNTIKPCGDCKGDGIGRPSLNRN